MDSVANSDPYDVIIVGAGPAGLSATASARRHQLRALTLEQGSVAHTLDYHYQHGKYVMSQPALIPLRSLLPFQAGSRESVLAAWQEYIAQHELNVHFNEAAKTIEKHGGTFQVQTAQATYAARHVILSIGKLGNPRSLHVPDESLPHVSHRLVDPRSYVDQSIAVIGGGDSAAEVALALSDQNRVSIIYRGAEFYRMNDSLRGQLMDQIDRKAISAYFNAEVERITEHHLDLALPEQAVCVEADSVFVKIGAEVPRRFLEACGVTFPSAAPSALPEIDHHYESTVPGLFLVGSVSGQDLIKPALNQGYEVIEHILGHTVAPVDEPLLHEKLAPVSGSSVADKLETISCAVPLFASMPRQQLRELLLVSTTHQVEQGGLIFRENEYSTTFFTVLNGGVEIIREAEPDRPLDELHAGEFFGEMGLLADRPRSATVRATAPTILIETPRRTMLKLIHSEPTVKRYIDEIYILRALRTYLGLLLSPEQFAQLATKTELVTYPKGGVVFSEGDRGDAFYVIRSGSVEISNRTSEGEKHILTYMHAGQYFGEMALLSEENQRGATVTAAAKAEVIRILRRDFLALLAEFPELQDTIQQEVHKRDVEHAVLLETPERADFLADFIRHGVVESTDILLIDETKCIRCDNCEIACAATHAGHTRLDRKRGPSFANVHVPVACRHCEGAPCLQDCPPGDAILRDAQGVVRIHEQSCIGCGNCASLCPYGVIFMVEVKPRQSFMQRFSLWNILARNTRGDATDSPREVAVKCDLCEGLAGGPACVRSCPTGAAIRVSPEYFHSLESRQA